MTLSQPMGMLAGYSGATNQTDTPEVAKLKMRIHALESALRSRPLPASLTSRPPGAAQSAPRLAKPAPAAIKAAIKRASGPKPAASPEVRAAIKAVATAKAKAAKVRDCDRKLFAQVANGGRAA